MFRRWWEIGTWIRPANTPQAPDTHTHIIAINGRRGNFEASNKRRMQPTNVYPLVTSQTTNKHRRHFETYKNGWFWLHVDQQPGIFWVWSKVCFMSPWCVCVSQTKQHQTTGLYVSFCLSSFCFQACVAWVVVRRLSWELMLWWRGGWKPRSARTNHDMLLLALLSDMMHPCSRAWVSSFYTCVFDVAAGVSWFFFRHAVFWVH